MKPYLSKLVQGQNLSAEEMVYVMRHLMQGSYSDIQIAGFLVALAIKGETAEELASAVKVMRLLCPAIEVASNDFVDIVSTGGSIIRSFNISTTAMFIASGAGANVAKHGTRGFCSPYGSSEVLEFLGINIHLTGQQISQMLHDKGICFMYGPLLHPAMKFAMPSRRGLGIRTIFNLLEPMANPAGAKKQVIGTFSRPSQKLMAEAFQRLGDSYVMLVHGADGMDEITTTAETHVIEVRNGQQRSYTLCPEEFGIQRARLADLEGGDLPSHAKILREVLKGAKGPCRDIALLNGAAAIYMAGCASDLHQAHKMAVESVDSGRALGKLQDLIEQTAKCC
jgi:anthranilate phosphoribosyltransferase